MSKQPWTIGPGGMPVCRICGKRELPRDWSFIAWCDHCLKEGLRLRGEGLTIEQAADLLREREAGAN